MTLIFPGLIPVSLVGALPVGPAVEEETGLPYASALVMEDMNGNVIPERRLVAPRIVMKNESGRRA